MDSKTEEFYQQQMTREGHCIECGAKIAVVNGERSACDCRPKHPPTEGEKEFEGFVSAYLKKFPVRP